LIFDLGWDGRASDTATFACRPPGLLTKGDFAERSLRLFGVDAALTVAVG